MATNPSRSRARTNHNVDDRLTDRPERSSRAASDADRKDDAGHMSLEERVALIRDEFRQEALPKVPDMPGWHLCWLSTSNSYDPIHKRMRLGYTPVSTDEIPGFASMKASSGEFEGCVACNEMLLFKIPADMYHAIMREFHHSMPANEEAALKSRLEDGADRTGRKLTTVTEDSDGFEELASPRAQPREPIFAD